MHSWVYLPKDAPSRPGPWHLPQVRAQALQALIHDVAGWARTVHTLIVVLLGLVGTIALVLAISGVAEGVLLWLLTSSGALAVIVWALWGLWLERSQWRVIGAIKRWHGASASGSSASGQVAGPSVRQLWTGALLVRLLGALALSAGAGWVIARAAQMPVSYPRLAAAAYLAVAAVALIGAVSVLGATLATALTLVRPPSPRPVPAMPGAAGPVAPELHHTAAAPAAPAFPTAGLAQGGPAPDAPGAPPGGSPGMFAADEAGQTRLADHSEPVPPAPAQEPREVVVLLSDGRHLPDQAISLIGRDPTPREGEQVDALLRISDQSISKTHLGVRICGERVWVTDRASTNGTVLVRPDGTQGDLEPWQETVVPAGSVVKLGSSQILIMPRADVPTRADI